MAEIKKPAPIPSFEGKGLPKNRKKQKRKKETESRLREEAAQKRESLKSKGKLEAIWDEKDELLEHLQTDPEEEDWRAQNKKYSQRAASFQAALKQRATEVASGRWNGLVTSEEHREKNPCVVHAPTSVQLDKLFKSIRSESKSNSSQKAAEPFCSSREDKLALLADANHIMEVEQCLAKYAKGFDAQLVTLINNLGSWVASYVKDTEIGTTLELHVWQLMDKTVFLVVYLRPVGNLSYKYLRCTC